MNKFGWIIKKIKEKRVMGKYQEDAKLLLTYVGGKENIAAVSHVYPGCVLC